jgi:hypothetical protein
MFLKDKNFLYTTYRGIRYLLPQFFRKIDGEPALLQGDKGVFVQLVDPTGNLLGDQQPLSVKRLSTQLPDLVTPSLAAGASYTEITWNDLDNFNTILSIAVDAAMPGTQPISLILENHFNDVNIGNRIYYTQGTGTNLSSLIRKDDIGLRYFRNFIKNTDTVSRSFIIKRRSFNA